MNENRRALDPHVADLLQGMGSIEAKVDVLLDTSKTNTKRIGSLEVSRGRFKGWAGGVSAMYAALLAAVGIEW